MWSAYFSLFLSISAHFKVFVYIWWICGSFFLQKWEHSSTKLQERIKQWCVIQDTAALLRVMCQPWCSERVFLHNITFHKIKNMWTVLIKKNIWLQVWQCRHFENLVQQLMWKGKFDSSFILKTVKGATSFFLYKDW